jgi:cell division protein FtsL
MEIDVYPKSRTERFQKVVEYPGKRSNNEKPVNVVYKAFTTGLRFYALVIFIIIAPVFVIWEHHQVDLMVKQLEELEKEAVELKNENERLKVSISRLSSYSRISSIAKDQLGLIPTTEKPEILIVPYSEEWFRENEKDVLVKKKIDKTFIKD